MSALDTAEQPEPWHATLAALVAETVPADDDPSAAEAGIAAAVVRVLAAVPEQAAWVAAGCGALDRASRAQHGQPFAALPSAARHALMTQLARGSPPAGWTAADPRPEQWWGAVRGLAVAQFYGSPAGHALTGFPGPAVDRGGYRHTLVEPDPLRHQPISREPDLLRSQPTDAGADPPRLLPDSREPDPELHQPTADHAGAPRHRAAGESKPGRDRLSP
jgi:hypothetical protein